jgi:hypothetical protein
MIKEDKEEERVKVHPSQAIHARYSMRRREEQCVFSGFFLSMHVKIFQHFIALHICR